MSTFQVDFMGEERVDNGGPRREWIRLMKQAIKEKNLNHGLRSLFAQDYFYAEIMIAVVLLQNGQLPVFVEESILLQVVSSQEGVLTLVFSKFNEALRNWECIQLYSSCQCWFIS